jgi:hypothetical protein
MDVKSDKTFEEIVERLAALFKLTPLAGEGRYEASTGIESPQRPSDTPQPSERPVAPSKNKN